MNSDKSKYKILKSINNPSDLRKLKKTSLIDLCLELRQFLIESIVKCSGHLSSGLGVVELTIALHYVYNTPFDKLIWDIGHQAYPHKIITGRRDIIHTIRKKGGLHPFPWREESEYDQLSVGHSSTSISAGLGMSVASDREGLERKIVCIIGDGAITAGIAFEAMNHAGDIKSNLLIILNDNGMSISKNVGALNNYYTRSPISKFFNFLLKNKDFFISRIPLLKNKIKKIEKYIISLLSPKNFFKDLGFGYTGIVDGHNLLNLIRVLEKIKIKNGPQVLHILTKKGYGHKPAEIDPIKWHSIPKFSLGVNDSSKNNSSSVSYSYMFGDWLCSVASKDNKLMAVTPAMCEGSGMYRFSREYPNQYFDVAIAEQHAVTFSAGLSISGYNTVVAIYSTFLQRAYDQVIHDIAIQNLPVLFAIDRGGIVGADGETHQGSFDLSYLRCIPNMIIMTPSDENEFRLMLNTGYMYKNGPSAVRYPKGNIIGVELTELKDLPLGKGVIRHYGSKIAILNFGTLLVHAKEVAKELNATLVDMRFVKPLDKSIIKKLSFDHKIFITIEENSIIGGAGSGVNEFILNQKISVPVLNIGIPDSFIAHGDQEEIRSDIGLDGVGILRKIKEWIRKTPNS